MTNLKKLPGAIKFALFASAATLVSGNAIAQETETDAKTLDRVEVTGSRLKRAEIEGATPVVVIDRATIDRSGDVSVAEVLRDSSFASFGNVKPASGSTAQSLATINLRGLDSGRTLVLIDGHRAPTNPMSASSGADLNSIPLAAVERIEILSDGASAVYGSDAIGGVVNVILRKDFNGVELRYGVGQTKIQGGDTEDASVVFGLSNDRGHLLGGVSTSSRDMVYTRDQIGGDSLGVSTYGNNYRVYNSPTLADFDASTHTVGPRTAYPGFDCTQNGFWVTASGSCSFDFNSVAANEAQTKNKAIFARGDYQINDDWTVYTTATFTKITSFGRYAPTPGAVWVDSESLNDPVPGDGYGAYVYHRFAAAGNRDTTTDATNGDFLLGFQGQLTDTVSVDFGLRRTQYDYNEFGRGFIVTRLAEQAIANGTYDLRDPFGADPDVLKGITATLARQSQWKTHELFATASFDVFEMGGGASTAVVGAEYRKDMYFDKYDPLSESGQILGSSGNSSGGERELHSAYFEWLFPFTSSFDITVAGRYDMYSDYGNDFSPKIAARWQPIDNLTFRASYGEGFRAPQLDILTANTTFSAESVFDLDTFVAQGGDPADYPDTTQVDTHIVSNHQLTSEQSKQWSAGVVYDPFDWLDVSLDYYNIEIEDKITYVSAQTIIDRNNDPSLGNIPAGLGLVRDPVSNEILDVTTGYANEGKLKTNGLDLRINTKFDLGAAGRLSNQLAVSYINSYKIDQFEYIGNLGQPQWRAGLNNTWDYGDLSVSWNVNYIDGQEDSTGQVGGYATNDLQFSYKTPWNSTVAIGANNVGDRYPELVGYDNRPWNFNLYDAYGRTIYFRYTQQF